MFTWEIEKKGKKEGVIDCEIAEFTIVYPGKKAFSLITIYVENYMHD